MTEKLPEDSNINESSPVEPQGEQTNTYESDYVAEPNRGLDNVSELENQESHEGAVAAAAQDPAVVVPLEPDAGMVAGAHAAEAVVSGTTGEVGVTGAPSVPGADPGARTQTYEEQEFSGLPGADPALSVTATTASGVAANAEGTGSDPASSWNSATISPSAPDYSTITPGASDSSTQVTSPGASDYATLPNYAEVGYTSPTAASVPQPYGHTEPQVLNHEQQQQPSHTYPNYGQALGSSTPQHPVTGSIPKVDYSAVGSDTTGNYPVVNPAQPVPQYGARAQVQGEQYTGATANIHSEQGLQDTPIASEATYRTPASQYGQPYSSSPYATTPPSPYASNPYTSGQAKSSTPGDTTTSSYTPSYGQVGAPAPTYPGYTHGGGYAQTTTSSTVNKAASRISWTTVVVSAFLAVVVSFAMLNFGGSIINSVSKLDRTDSILESQNEGGTTAEVTSTSTYPDWESVADAVRPATVTIQTSGTSSTTGSGVIYNTSGLVVTNNHVVSSVTSNTTIYITLYDSRVYTASVLGTDSTTDVAVLQIQDAPSDLVAARFTSSSDLQVGQQVMAIGAPLGLSDTVTTGIISAIDRPVSVTTQSYSENYFGYTTNQETVITNTIQIDASINPGNSGGPLFDSTGAVIGINSSIATTSSSSDSSGSIGLGFAIPSDLVVNVVTQIVENGSAKHAYLGVTATSTTVTVDDTTVVAAGIVSVVEGTAAANAGLQADDAVIAIDGKQVVSSTSLTGFVRTYNPGDTAILQVVRDGQLLEITVVLGESTS